MTRHKKHKHPRWHSLFLWHRYIGLSSALFVLLLASTGLLLNHTATLKLDQQYVGSSLLLDWYGVSVPEAVSYNADGRRVSKLGDRLFFDRQELLHDPAPLLGALYLENACVIALQQTLLLVSDEGKIIERLGSSEGVPSGMRRIGVSATGQLVIDAVHGYYLTDSAFLDWSEVETVNKVVWAQTEQLPAALQKQLHQQYRGMGLTLERVLLDLHSGRILGGWGIYVMDAAAIALLLLAILGVWIWGSRKRK